MYSRKKNNTKNICLELNDKVSAVVDRAMPPDKTGGEGSGEDRIGG